MTNYEKALRLVDEGIAIKHSISFDKTGCIFIDLGDDWAGYVLPRNKFVVVTIDNVHVAYGNIDLDKMMVMDASHRPDYDRYIVKSEV